MLGASVWIENKGGARSPVPSARSANVRDLLVDAAQKKKRSQVAVMPAVKPVMFEVNTRCRVLDTMKNDGKLLIHKKTSP